MTSLALIAILLATLVFGYFSLGRFVYQTQNRPAMLKQRLKSVSPRQVLFYLSLSTLFYSLPSLSISLYWGWGPALLWLIFSHFLIEISLNAHSGSIQATQHQSSSRSLFDILIHPDQTGINKLLHQLFLLLICCICLSMLTLLINQHSGLLFYLACLCAAMRCFSYSNSSQTDRLTYRIVGLIIIAFGLLLTLKMGVVFHGQLSPLHHQMPWLTLNNSALIAIILLLAGLRYCDEPGFGTQIKLLSGSLITILAIALLLSLLVSMPAIDAPLNNAQSDQPPPFFIAICILMFPAAMGSALALFTQQSDGHSLKTDHQKHGLSATSTAVGSFIALLLIALITITVASANGIGAWSTHFLHWQTDLSLFDQLKLIQNTVTHLFGNHPLVALLFPCALVTVGVALLLHCLKLLTDSDTPTSDQNKPFRHVKVFLLILLITLAMISRGISLSDWLLFGICNWLVICGYLINTAMLDRDNALLNQFLSAIALLFLFLGGIQSLRQIVLWLMEQQRAHALVAILLLCGGFFIFKNRVYSLLTSFNKKRELISFD